MMQEELTGHQVEWEVVEGPAEDRHANFIIEAFEVDIIIVAVASLPSDDS